MASTWMGNDIVQSRLRALSLVEMLGYNRSTFMAITIGEQLGSQEITSLLGRGGMGEVYCARDTQLGRNVAFKVLREVFESDPNRLSRFRSEAQLLASLNHPNIAQIYGVVEVDHTRGIVMELVQAETLQSCLERGALPVEEALAIQIAEALVAHDQMITGQPFGGNTQDAVLASVLLCWSTLTWMGTPNQAFKCL